jgi:2-C-methyl-D-erythritol 4-phosphate cytidylyltransferase
MKVSAIVLAAGLGVRFKSKASKMLVEINRQPIIIYSLKTLSKISFINEIIVVANSNNRRGIARIIRKFSIAKVSRIVEGGRRRQDSVYNGLKNLSSSAELVLIHDGARPFIDKKTIASVIKKAEESGGAVVGVLVKATIKEAQGAVIKRTLDRKSLWEIQTPQVFKKGLILKAYRKSSGTEVTDDASLVEKSGGHVVLVKGSYFNIKITTPEDALLAEAIAKSLKGKV